MARRFDKAIKQLNYALTFEAGKAAQEYAKLGRVDLVMKTVHVKNLKLAIEILEQHQMNVNI